MSESQLKTQRDALKTLVRDLIKWESGRGGSLEFSAEKARELDGIMTRAVCLTSGNMPDRESGVAAGLPEAIERLTRAINVFHHRKAGEHDEMCADASRLAELEKRVGSLIETLWTEPDTETSVYRAQLAALRPLLAEPPPMTPELQAELEAYQPSYTRLSDEGKAAFDKYDGPVSCGAPGPMALSCEGCEKLKAQLDEAHARRRRVCAQLGEKEAERHAAVTVVRDWLTWRDRRKFSDDAVGDRDLWATLSRARALVAGQGVAASGLDAIMTEREADLIGESLAAERVLREQIAARDAEIETLRAKLAEAQRHTPHGYVHRQVFVEALEQRDALRAHALKLDGLCERAVKSCSRSEPNFPLADALRARGEVPR